MVRNAGTKVSASRKAYPTRRSCTHASSKAPGVRRTSLLRSTRQELITCLTPAANFFGLMETQDNCSSGTSRLCMPCACFLHDAQTSQLHRGGPGHGPPVALLTMTHRLLSLGYGAKHLLLCKILCSKCPESMKLRPSMIYNHFVLIVPFPIITTMTTVFQLRPSLNQSNNKFLTGACPCSSVLGLRRGSWDGLQVSRA